MKFKLIILLLIAFVALPFAYPYIFPQQPDSDIAGQTPDLPALRETRVAEGEPEPEVIFEGPVEDPYIPPEVRDPGERLLVFGQLPEEFLPLAEEPVLVAEIEPEPEIIIEEPGEDPYIPPEVRDPGQGLLVFGQLPEEFLPIEEEPVLVAEVEPEITIEEPPIEETLPPEVRDPGEGLLVFGQLPEEFLPLKEVPILVAELEEKPEGESPAAKPEEGPDLNGEETPADEDPRSVVETPVFEESAQVVEEGQETSGRQTDFSPLRVLYPNQTPQTLHNTLKIFTMPVVVTQSEGEFKNRFHPFDIGKKTGRLLFAPEISGNGVVVIEDPASGETTPITGPKHSASMPVWSPDEAFIAFASEQDGRSAIYIKNVASGAERRVVGLPHFARNPAWSPDGTELAFLSNAEGSWDIWVITIVGGALRRITTNPRHEYNPKWSPDGRMLTFFTTWNNGTDIWVVDINSGEIEQLTDDDHENYRPVWAPEGGDIIFVSDRTGKSEIWSLSLETRALTQITETEVEIDFPLFARGGKEVLFISWAKAVYLRGLRDTPGGWDWAELPWWQTAPWLEGVEDVALSPDGTSMVFRRAEDASEQLFIYFFTRRETRQLTYGRSNSYTPVWLADGSGFLFSRSLGDWESSRIYKYTLVGAREELLVDQPNSRFPIICGDDLYFLAPEVAYTGRAALWRKHLDEEGSIERMSEDIFSPEKMSCAPSGDALYVVGWASDKREITQFSPADGSFTPLPLGPWTEIRPIEEFDPSDDFNPTASPDGKKIAFISNRDGTDGIYVKFLETNEVRRITYTKEQESGLFWSPDSTNLYTTSRLEEFAFQKVRIIDVFGSEFIGPV